MADDHGLQKKIKDLLNSESRESESNTPDYILANYLLNCLRAYEAAVQQRENWWGAPLDRPKRGEVSCP